MAPNASHSPLTNRQLGFLVALASWGMLFGTFILSFLLYRARLPVWPPVGVETIPPLMPTLATGMLLASSFFIHSAYRQLVSADRSEFRRYWGIGTFLGLLFLILQAGTWNHMLRLGMGIRSNFFASIYYTLTGLHALHVLTGLGFLAWVWLKSDRYSQKNYSVPQLSGWFWHFMDAIWIVLFVLLVVI
ncbi:MAG: heme-copper oxidase subunit III [Bdellovibrionales bacterium]|nr:heme-copper oxidase subunit III [Bdellovibrionales bacterium]